MPYDYTKYYCDAIDKQYGAGTREAKRAKSRFLNRIEGYSVEKDKLPEYLHGLYDEIAKQEGNKKDIDTKKEINAFHERAYYTIDRSKVPSCLLADYDKIAKSNNNNIIDTKTEANKFQDKVETAYNYGDISLDIAKEMGFVGHRKQGAKTGEYAENGYIIGRILLEPIPIIRQLSGGVGGIIGGATGLICDGVELVKEKCCGKKNNDLIGINQKDCEKFHDVFFKTKSLCTGK